ncbi:MAG: hypothetical protein JJU25_04640 [Halomonas sp.]|nr:KilA-N domain-containing protein [Halomonas sp.]MCC5881907.1 hypothetical protein [Halomonas sp.]
MTGPETKVYLKELARTVKITDLTRKGSRRPFHPQHGTWAHPKVPTFFALWLGAHVAVACGQMIDEFTSNETMPVVSKIGDVRLLDSCREEAPKAQQLKA